MLGNHKIACIFIINFNTLLYTVRKILLVLIFTVLFTACEEEKEALEFTNYSVEKSYEACNPEEGECTFISINYPVAEGENEAAKEINRAITNHIIEVVDYRDDKKIESIEGLADRFIENFETTASDFPEYQIPSEASVLGEISLRTEDLISFRFSSEIFTGGAHGYSSVSFLNFNPETGATYSHEELFTSEFKEFFEEKFREDQNIPQNEPINSNGLFFEDDKFVLPQNIGFSQNELVLHYNAYEISSYADGNIIYRFPYAEVEEFLKVGLQEIPVE
ncbi:DUF3298 and DUF4163 domain-containing protein [Zunongwangia sp. F260]|uniref:DUF3298 and DUF4163 domain-containing protein n=1 Tax=Autumnicola lenta TaxID=3075593 RepID=A0ABU3CH69_9FLAO|nr:DUF3298 and DUF4163 domain-containing protein [Zunongwangia sp. F260]MDT0645695.1 DUF3298 and DUF4163 domain-containing protein [Zunongwangia sp. F260]